MTDIRNNIVETIGNTPIVRLNRVTDGLDAEILAKVEFFNPGGSMKDRIAVTMVEDAERSGVLKPGGTIVECTSGNTGFGLAIVAALKGYKCIFVLPDKMSNEKIKNLRAFGAKVVVTPTAVEPDDPRSYYSVARRLAKETPNAVLMNQYDNLSNREAHYKTTGPEIIKQLDGKLDAFVAGMGTGGSITGTAKYLKEKNKNIQIVGVDPIGSILHDYIKSGKMTTAHTYKIEGIGEDFIPKNYDFSIIDDVMQVTDKEAFQMTRRILLEEGIFSGVTSAAAVCGAIKYAKKVGGKKRIVVLFPDSGNRYMSKVFDDDWMKENGFLEQGLGLVEDLIEVTLGTQKQNIISAEPTDSVEKVVTIMSSKGISQIPVMKGREIVGLISENNILTSLFNGKIKKSDTVGSLVENSFIKVTMKDELERVSQSLSAGVIPIAVNANGEIISMITKIDLINFISKRSQ